MKLLDKLNAIQNNKEEVLEEIGKLVRDDARTLTNSSAIRADLAYEIDENLVRIGTNVFYSALKIRCTLNRAKSENAKLIIYNL